MCLLLGGHRAQHPVDEAAGAIAAEALTKLHSLVDGRLRGHLPIIKQDLPDCKAKEVLVDRWHLLQRPGRRGPSNLGIQSLSIAEDAFDKTPRVSG